MLALQLLEIMLKADHISKSYGDLEVLKNVSIEVADSEVVAITGKSGAGKSTLLHILGTLDSPDKGNLLINGIDPLALNSKKLADFRNRHIGFVFQFHHLLSEFSAIENVIIPALIKGDSNDIAMKKAEELLTYLGIGNRLLHKPSQLSGGEQQRVAFARALMNKPDIIFADEPTGNLDSTTSEELHKLIFDLRDEFGQTFIIVTHNQVLTDMCDRRIHLKDGVISS